MTDIHLVVITICLNPDLSFPYKGGEDKTQTHKRGATERGKTGETKEATKLAKEQMKRVGTCARVCVLVPELNWLFVLGLSFNQTERAASSC